MEGCTHTEEFLGLEREALKKAIDEHKWYLSEQAGYDIGYQFAQADFIQKYISIWGEIFRKKYCTRQCLDRDVCQYRASIAA